jgi:hypothetical protein
VFERNVQVLRAEVRADQRAQTVARTFDSALIQLRTRGGEPPRGNASRRGNTGRQPPEHRASRQQQRRSAPLTFRCARVSGSSVLPNGTASSNWFFTGLTIR